MPIARSIRITGHVQGVFFREWTVQVANALDIAGWVRNEDDGSVAIYALGTSEQLERLVVQLRIGPPSSRVDSIEIEDAAVEAVSGFMRRATA